MQTLLRLTRLSTVLSQNSLASYWAGKQTLAPHLIGEAGKFHAGIFDHWPILPCLGLVPAASQPTFIIG